MPELPEVELLKRHLDPRLRGCRITSVEVIKNRITRPDPPEAVVDALCGTRIQCLLRKGKYLVLDVETGQKHRESNRILVHLGMTGRLYMQTPTARRSRFAAVTFGLVKGSRRETLVFDDVRLFGRLTLDIGPLDRLGLEPFSSGFTEAAFRNALTRSAQPVKPRLLDQSVVAGLGNIYACEALHAAKVAPGIRSNALDVGQVRRLHRAIGKVLHRAVEFGSGLDLEWTGASGNDGLFYFGERRGSDQAPSEERFAVYDRAGERCRRCGDSIARIVMAGRSTYYCPSCQT